MNFSFYNIISNYSSVKTLFMPKRKILKGALPCISHCPAIPLHSLLPSFSVDRKGCIR